MSQESHAHRRHVQRRADSAAGYPLLGRVSRVLGPDVLASLDMANGGWRSVLGRLATVALREQGGLDALVWSFRPERTPRPRSMSEVPTTSPESVALSKALRGKGFRFVGPTTMYSLTIVHY